MKVLLCILILLSFAAIVEAKHLHYEKEYQDAWCKQHCGKSEVRLFDNTRVDCITEKEAIEFDFANKWAECTGQALYYRLITGKTPACVLIIENKDKETIYLQRLQGLSNKYGFKVYTMTPADI